MKKLLLIALALTFISVGAVYAQPAGDDAPPAPGGMMPMHPMGPMGHMGMMGMGDDDDDFGCRMMGIEFNKEQQAKLDQMRLDGQRTMIERNAKMVEMQSKLKLAMTSEKYSAKEVEDIAGKIGKFHQEGIVLRAKHLREVRDMLTPEQRVRFDQKVLSSPMMGGKGMGMGMGGPGFHKGRGMGMGKGGPGCGSDCKDDCDHMKNRRGHGWN